MGMPRANLTYEDFVYFISFWKYNFQKYSKIEFLYFARESQVLELEIILIRGNILVLLRRTIQSTIFKSRKNYW